MLHFRLQIKHACHLIFDGFQDNRRDDGDDDDDDDVDNDDQTPTNIDKKVDKIQALFLQTPPKS